jgi:hypothetical protein
MSELAFEMGRKAGLRKAADEIEALRELVKQQSTFIDAAFEVYSNLDLDVEQVIVAKEDK